MTEQTLRQYLKEYRVPILLACIASIFLAGFLWHFYPTFNSCCDAENYWLRSDSLKKIRSSDTGFRTFIYPILIAASRFLPRLFKSGVEAELIALSLVQLCFYFIGSISLGYIAYSLTNNKVITTWVLYIYALDIFLLAQTNQVLTDGVAISFLVIAIAIIVFCLDQIKPSSLPIAIAGVVVGALPLIRPSLVSASITLSALFLLAYCYKHKFDLLTFSLIGLYSFCFLLPLAIQLWLVPETIQFLQDLSKFQSFHGAYIFKYMTIAAPRPHGYAAISESMKELVQVCENLPNPTNCIKDVMLANPLQALGHYAAKLLTVNDQVYLTTYVMDFYTPERQIWRLINCLFSATSVCGAFALTRRGIKEERKYLVCAIVSGILISVLMIPFIVGAPEERFGLTFHPFLVFFTSYFINDFLQYGRQSKLRVLGLHLILTSLLLIFSLRIELLFTYGMNY